MRSLLFRSLIDGSAVIAPPQPGSAAVAELAKTLGQQARARLGRSLAIREVDAGSCNGCELEIHAINNPVYDVERFGLKFVASPRHADVLLVTGPVTWNMREALGAHPCRNAVAEMGGGARGLRRQLRCFRRQLRLCRSRQGYHSRRSAHQEDARRHRLKFSKACWH